MKQIITACGSGVATSQTVASKVNRMLMERKVNARVEAVNINNINAYMKTCVAYISIFASDKRTFPVPVIDGIPFLTGVGAEAQFEKLLKAIGEK